MRAEEGPAAKRPVSVLSLILLVLMVVVIIFLVLMQNLESLKDYFGSATFKIIFDIALVLCLALFAAYIFARGMEYHRSLEAMVTQLERGNAQLRVLNEIQAKANSSLDAQELLGAALASVMPVISSLGTIYLLDDATSLLAPRASHGTETPLEEMPSFAAGEGIVGKVAETGSPIEDRGGGEGGRGLSRYAVPIWAGSKFVGVMVAGTAAGPYGEEEKTLLHAVSDVLGNSLTNARLYDLTRRALNATKRTQAYLEGFVNEAPMGIVLTDEKGSVLVVNREAEEMLGVRAKDLLGRTASELQVEMGGEVGELARELRGCVSSGRAGRIRISAPGPVADVYADVFPLRLDRGGTIGAAATLRRSGVHPASPVSDMPGAGS